MKLRGTRVLVMGLGVHGGGLGVARWLLRQGAVVTVTDLASPETLTGPLETLRQAEAECDASIRYVLGEHRADDFAGHAIIVANPAVRPNSPWLTMARESGAHIETEMTLFFRRCPGPILGVTGTKGKTTTALLLGAMLRQEYPDTIIAGNLRVSALEALDRISVRTPVVLELSSFQLVGLGAACLSPQYACITNISPDHLNYHGSMAEYVRAKQQIFAHQDRAGVVVLNHEQQAAIGGEDWGSEHGILSARSCSNLLTFSIAPESDADCRITQGRIELHGEELCAVADVRLMGDHNLTNVLAAATMAHSFGVSPASIRAAVQACTGVEHRLEFVRELDGVRYINDTTATNPAAAQAALASIEAPIVLLAGGADKDLDFEAFAQVIRKRVKTLVLLMGSATPRLQRALHMAAEPGTMLGTQRATPLLGPYDDFATAIRAARSYAEPGDVVLLSPGCASFGMFANEFHRGEEFRRIVCELT
ncbi:MAG: UDP-N-acetylmuramoyl-L-alanine--D-glutamate ligase [Chloroflexales bacterium]|nr:UDP-N-acetylmuramoyl-L-alanine--D-glutamate ligase [Chloroflexales bacterium]